MSQLPEGAYITTVDGKQCTAIPRRPVAGASYNISVPCQPSLPLAKLEEKSTKFNRATVPHAMAASSTPAVSPSSKVKAEEVTPRSSAVNSDHSFKAVATSTSSSSQPKPSASANPTIALAAPPPPPAEKTVVATTTVTPLPTVATATSVLSSIQPSHSNNNQTSVANPQQPPPQPPPPAANTQSSPQKPPKLEGQPPTKDGSQLPPKDGSQLPPKFQPLPSPPAKNEPSSPSRSEPSPPPKNDPSPPPKNEPSPPPKNEPSSPPKNEPSPPPKNEPSSPPKNEPQPPQKTESQPPPKVKQTEAPKDPNPPLINPSKGQQNAAHTSTIKATADSVQETQGPRVSVEDVGPPPSSSSSSSSSSSKQSDASPTAQSPSQNPSQNPSPSPSQSPSPNPPNARESPSSAAPKPSPADPKASDPKASSPGVADPVVQTTLATSATPAASSQDAGKQPTPTGQLPKGAANGPFLGDSPSDSKPIGDIPGSAGPSKPAITAPEASSDGKSPPSTGAIVGITIGSLAGLVMIAFMFWFMKRRSKRRDSSLASPTRNNEYGSMPGNPNATTLLGGRFGQWLPARGRRDTVDNVDARPGFSNNRGATPDMEERAAVPVYGSSTSRDGPSRQPPNQMAYGNWSHGPARNDEIANTTDPFSDSNAIRLPAPMPSLPLAAMVFDDPMQNQAFQMNEDMPSTFPARGRSSSAGVRASQDAAPNAGMSRPHSVHRDSMRSVDSFADKRKKFRSDPFDLEIESRLISSGSMPGLPGQPMASAAYGARPLSNSSSRYTSGVTVSDWGSIEASNRPDPNTAAANPFLSWDNPAGASPPKTSMANRGRPVGKSGVVFGQAM